jgi:hypothetical protein
MPEPPLTCGHFFLRKGAETGKSIERFFSMIAKTENFVGGVKFPNPEGANIFQDGEGRDKRRQSFRSKGTPRLKRI